jgi:hypothetical protein
MKFRKSLALAASAAACTIVTGALAVAPAQARTTTLTYGTVSGTLTTQGGALLNGMCVNLYKGSYLKGKVITTAPTGTGGPNGFFTQANVPTGTYTAFFWNCGANVSGTPDPNYVNIFYGNTYVPSKATKFTVSAGATTSLGTNPIPLGGTITGTVTDSTLGGPATDSPAVGILIPGAAKLNLQSSQGWYIVCANSSNGQYSVSGVPTGGVKVVFAPANWGCPYNANGDFNFGFYNQSTSGSAHTTAEGTLTVNGSVTEGSSYPAAGASPGRPPAAAASARVPRARS